MRARACACAAVIIVAVACAANGMGPQRDPRAFDAARTRMVDEQLRSRDIRDPRVLDAMRRVPRHEFVPEARRGDAYIDSPVPIGEGQTI